MRTIRINRPKRLEAAMTGLIVEVDGGKIGKLGNGTMCTAQIDEHAHELYLHGGKLAAKGFSTKLSIPAGDNSYTFQVDMMSISSGGSSYKPVLRPCGDAVLKGTTRTVTLLGTTLTTVLLDEKLRELLVKLPQARLQLVLQQNQWGLLLCCESQKKAILTQPYSQAKGGLLALTLNTIEHGDLKTPEGLEKLTNQIFEEYINYLPDYKRVSPNEFVLVR